MPVHKLCQLVGYKWFTDWSNNKHMADGEYLTCGKPQKGVNCCITAEYTADQVTCYAE